jgi:hypothetical protein
MELMEAVRHIEKKMAKNVKAPSSDKFTSSKSKKKKISNKGAKSAETKGAPKTKGSNWRVDEKSFVDCCTSRVFQKGLENYSSGWLAQGHQVGKPVILQNSTAWF